MITFDCEVCDRAMDIDALSTDPEWLAPYGSYPVQPRDQDLALRRGQVGVYRMIDYACEVCDRTGLTRRDIMGNGDDEGHGLANGGECRECYEKRPACPIGARERSIMALEPLPDPRYPRHALVHSLDGGTRTCIGALEVDEKEFVPIRDGLAFWRRVVDLEPVFQRARESIAEGRGLAVQVDVRKAVE